MELVLTGGMMTAKEAETAGLVARVVPNDKVLLILFSSLFLSFLLYSLLYSLLNSLLSSLLSSHLFSSLLSRLT